MARISLKVNGRARTIEADPKMPLLYALRDNLALKNPRFGCGLAQCGACTVLLDNQPIRSCSFPTAAASGHEVVTLEGIGTPKRPHPIQKAWIAEEAMQCGYCLNGWMMSAKALLDRNPNPSDAEIRQAFAGLICRCGAQTAMFRAVRRASQEIREA